MKESIRKVFQCDFCKRNMLVKHACDKHENFCSKNPKNFSACSGCKNLEEIKVDYLVDGYFDGRHYQEGKSCNGFKCKAKEIELYPLKAIKLGLVEKYPETFFGKELMPNQCDLFIIDLPF